MLSVKSIIAPQVLYKYLRYPSYCTCLSLPWQKEVNSSISSQRKNIEAKAEHTSVANTTFDVGEEVKKDDDEDDEKEKVEEREMKIENTDPIPVVDETVLKPWRVNMVKQSSIDKKDPKLLEEAEEPVLTKNTKKEDKPWRNNMKKSESVESQPSA